MDFLKSLPFELKMYFDLGRMRAFFTMGIPVSLDKTVSRDSLIIKISENLLNNASEITQKKIRVGEHEGVEFTLTDEDKAEIRMQIFVLNDFVALNAISAFKKVALTDHDAERFFNSFRVTETKKSGEENKNSRWKLYTYAEEGFEVESPVKLSVRKNIKGEDGWLQDTYQAFDLAGQTYYGLIVSTVQKGFFSSSDSETFEYMSSQFMSSMNATSVKSIHIVRDGYPAYESVASYDEEGEKIWLRVLFVNKGPRRYLLFTTSGNRGDSDNPGEQFFSSFRLFSPPMKNWESSMAPDETFSTWSPGKIVPFYEEDKSNDEIKYFILDPVNQLQITIDKEVFPSYYWVENDSLLFRNRVNNFFSDTDSLIYYTPFREGDIKAVDVLIKLYDTHNRKRMRLYLNGDTLYSVYTFIPDEFLNSDNYQKLFNDFKISYPVKPFDFTVRKPAALLEALKTKDSTAFETASTYLSESSFIADDIPLLQQAMLYLYRDFDSIYYFNTNKTIADLLEKLDSNHTSIRFFRENYPGITRENEYAKPYILGLLSQFKTQESYELLYDLLINQPPDIEETFYFSNGLSDSLELSRILYPGFIKLAGHPGFFDFANDHILMMIDSGVIDRAMLAPYKNEFIKTANRLLLIPRQELTDKSYQYLSLVKLLGILKQAETNQLLKKIVDLGDNELRLQALVALLKNGQQVDSRDIYTLATFDKYRLRLYEELKEMGKEKLFPADYLSQKRLGQSKIYEYAEEDYEPQTIDFVGERIETFMGKRQKFYLYKLWYSYDMDDNIYLGVAGPYSLNSRDMKCEHEVTSIYWDEIFDEKKVDQFLKELIKQAEH